MVDDYLRLNANILAPEGVAPSAEPIHVRRPRPDGARCDACHARRSRVQRSRDGLLTICSTCARGFNVATTDATDAIAAVTSRAPARERRDLRQRLQARRTMHEARRNRRVLAVEQD
jgi:hypothetical protein